jgi:hypothetical protein
MSAPLVSIVIPVYNGANYLREAIDSALAQTYNNCEVIVVNDGSIDNGTTESIALSYGDRIRYFSKENGGVGSALNLGIREMRGEYFSWLSHDDVYFPHKIEYQVVFLRELGRRDVVLYSDYLCVNSQNVAQYEVRMDHVLLMKKPLYAIFRGCLHGCTLLIPRNAFDEVGMFNLLPTTQDYDMWDRLIRRYPFIHMPNIFVRSRLHPEQTSHGISASAEANALWVRLMEQLTPKELAQLHPTPRKFFIDMLSFFRERNYKDAYAYARKKTGLWACWMEYAKAIFKASLNTLGMLPYTTQATDFVAWVFRFLAHNGFSPSAWRWLCLRLYFATKLRLSRSQSIPFLVISLGEEKHTLPLVSVIVPTYNRAHTLPFPLDSLQRQTYGNIEVIIVDDASTDDTRAICASFAEKWRGKVTYLRNDANIGVSASRNRGIGVAQGEYITFLDSDDDYTPEKIAKQVKALRETPCAGLCVSYFTTTCDMRTNENSKLVCYPPKKDWYPTFLNPQYMWFATPAIMTPRDVLLPTGGFEPSMHCCEDLDLWARILQYHHAVLVEEPLVRIGLRNEAPRYVEWLQGRHQLYVRLAQRDASVPQETIRGWYVCLASMYAARLKEPSPELLALFTRLFETFTLPFDEMQAAVTKLLNARSGIA